MTVLEYYGESSWPSTALGPARRLGDVVRSVPPADPDTRLVAHRDDRTFAVVATNDPAVYVTTCS